MLKNKYIVSQTELERPGEQQDLRSKRATGWIQQKVSGVSQDISRLAKVHTSMTAREEPSANVYDFSFPSIFSFWLTS